MRCELCPDRPLVDDVVTHLRDVHGEDVTIETWPDGRPVVVDLTLDPEDFR